MYKIDDMIMHPRAGVCRVKDIRKETFSKLGEKNYYVLVPIYEKNNSKIYIPVDSNIELRKILSNNDIEDIIDKVDLNEKLWIDVDNKRAEKFNSILKSGNHALIIQLIVEIYGKQKEKNEAGKKLHMSDQRILEEAKKLIHQEFAYALNLDVDEVAQYIMAKLNVS